MENQNNDKIKYHLDMMDYYLERAGVELDYSRIPKRLHKDIKQLKKNDTAHAKWHLSKVRELRNGN